LFQAASETLLQFGRNNLDGTLGATLHQIAEMYRRLGLADLGPLLSCSRDGEMIAGFNPEIAFERTQTLMEGASHCDFRYRRMS